MSVESRAANNYSLTMEEDGTVRLTFLDNRPDVRAFKNGNTLSDVVAEVILPHRLFLHLMDGCEKVLVQHNERKVQGDMAAAMARAN